MRVRFALPRVSDCIRMRTDSTAFIMTAYELNLKDGLHMERRLFHQLFATVGSFLSCTALFLSHSFTSSRLS